MKSLFYLIFILG